VAQEGAGSEKFLFKKQEFTVLQCRAAEPRTKGKRQREMAKGKETKKHH
jgi:hypothetical protein